MQEQEQKQEQELEHHLFSDYRQSSDFLGLNFYTSEIVRPEDEGLEEVSYHKVGRWRSWGIGCPYIPKL